MNRPRSGFHFQPVVEREFTQTDNAPLLFTSSPPSRKGRVTVFLRTRRTLRRRLGVHDLGQIDGVLQERERDIAHEELQFALSKRTQWRYLFPPDNTGDSALEENEFGALVDRTLAS